MSDERQKLDWHDLKVFTDDASGLAVCVRRGEGSGRPRYLVVMGRTWEGRFMRDLRAQYDTNHGGVYVTVPFDGAVFAELVEQARAHIAELQGEREKEFQARRQQPRNDERKSNDRGYGGYNNSNRGRKNPRDEEWG